MHQVFITLGTLLSMLVESAVSPYGTCSTGKKKKKASLFKKRGCKNIGIGNELFRHLLIFQYLIKPHIKI